MQRVNKRVKAILQTSAICLSDPACAAVFICMKQIDNETEYDEAMSTVGVLLGLLRTTANVNTVKRLRAMLAQVDAAVRDYERSDRRPGTYLGNGLWRADDGGVTNGHEWLDEKED